VQDHARPQTSDIASHLSGCSLYQAVNSRSKVQEATFTTEKRSAIITSAMRDVSSPRIFLSYSRKDGLEFARGLQAMLEAEGLSLYRDLSDLEGGVDWWRQVETAIKSVEHVVLVLTPTAAQSRYVRDEWKLARQEGRAVWPVSGPGDLNLSH